MKRYSKAQLVLINCLAIVQEMYCNAVEGSNEEKRCLLAKRSIYEAIKYFDDVCVSDNDKSSRLSR